MRAGTFCHIRNNEMKNIRIFDQRVAKGMVPFLRMPLRYFRSYKRYIVAIP